MDQKSAVESNKEGKMLRHVEELIRSYGAVAPEATDEEIWKALLAHAKIAGGCVSCVYSRCHPNWEKYKGNPWIARRCIFGLPQDACGMHKSILDIKVEFDEQGNLKI